jgi:UDP-N-acetylmuramoyl-tripeptide--D-alanyl-D-alanine ligase
MHADRIHSHAGMTLEEFISFSGGASRIPSRERTARIHAVWNDSRKVGPGDVFVAIATGNDDGHAYVKSALRRGAVAALVARAKLSAFSEEERERLIVARDPVSSLQSVASRYRATLPCTMVGITGSSGKTTTRTFISAVLRGKLCVGETQGNWNNHIGVPLSLLRFAGKEEAGVLEMGANHKREIHVLSNIIRPDIGVITNIGYAHIGYFGSLANILKAKFEIVDGMKKNGLLLLNGDDPLLVRGSTTAKQRVVFFGMSERCHIRAEDVCLKRNRSMEFVVGGQRYVLPMPGRHFVYAALAAIAAAGEFAISAKEVAAALDSLEPLSMRGSIRKKSGVTFIVDCYNANPSSMKSGIAMLTDVAGSKPKVAIVGDMLELGRYATQQHAILGKELAAANVDRILAVGRYSRKIAGGARLSGVPAKRIMTAATSSEAISKARKLVKRGDTVLLKGSRGIHLETVLEGF